MLYQEYIRNSRGVQLFTCRWLPSSSSPLALVFLCHGSSFSLSLSLPLTHTHTEAHTCEWELLINICCWDLQGMAWSAVVSWEVINFLKWLDLFYSLSSLFISNFLCLFIINIPIICVTLCTLLKWLQQYNSKVGHILISLFHEQFFGARLTVHSLFIFIIKFTH